MQYLQPNTTLQGGKYRINRLLGQGGFGNTYVAYNTEFEETVAIKEFFMRGVTERNETTSRVSVSNSENVLQFEEQREKFKKEARRLRRLRNEHIIKVHDLFEENGTAYYVMDFIDGESLVERLKRIGKPFNEDEVMAILRQVLEALKEVHDKEIWHLDLKPGNILLDKSGKAYLIDFGASKQVRANGSMTTSTALCYTPGFAPNEQIGQMYDRFGPWTDIYALGATIYNLLTNKKPPMAIDIEEDEEDAFDFPDSISEDMRKMVEWMMQPKRKKRPQSVEDILLRMPVDERVHPQTIDMVSSIIATTLSKGVHSETVFQNEDKKHFISKLEEKEKTLMVGSESLISNNVKAIDLGLSVLWADCNVGGNTESPIGGLYGWGDPTGNKTSQNVADYVPLRKILSGRIPMNIGGTEYDLATAKWGHGWRMPSKDDWKELIENCRWTKEKAYHVNGYRVEGPNGNSIFLPYTGIRFGEEISNVDSGYYWTSEMVPTDRSCAFYYFFGENKPNDIVTTRNYVYSGRAIRPIRDR